MGGCGVGSVLLFHFQKITRRRLKSSSTKRNNRFASRTQPKVVKSHSLLLRCSRICHGSSERAHFRSVNGPLTIPFTGAAWLRRPFTEHHPFTVIMARVLPVHCVPHSVTIQRDCDIKIMTTVFEAMPFTNFNAFQRFGPSLMRAPGFPD